ncbi:hypothetical protein OJ998_21745 [Solirubrobacter taibaiensis]|nr:hypothetical protein [Solirubrobacter taibaiensis]
MLRITRLLTLLVLSVPLLFAVSADAARADTGSIQVLSATGDAATATFTVTKTACDSPYYCGWYAFATRVVAAQACNEDAIVWVGTLQPGIGTATGTESNFPSYAGEGAHKLCLWLSGEGSPRLLAEVVYAQNGGPTPTPVPPAPTPAPAIGKSLVQSLMPRSVGTTSPSYAKLAIFPTGAPASVDSSRFIAVVRASAARWDISRGGVSWKMFNFDRPDGRNAIGFEPRPEGVLGTTNTWTARVYRKRRSCRPTLSGRKCRTVRKYVGRQVVEADVAIDPFTPWQQGPALPTTEQFDLETVIAHELGHWAGNGHRNSCSHLMTRAIDAGDWWRDIDDFHFSSCGASTKAVGAAHAAGRFEHVDRVHDVVLPDRVSDRDAGSYAQAAWARAKGK